jgi:hypothetical protein
MNHIKDALFRCALVAIACVTLAACPPVTSKTAIGTTVAATPEPGLAGLWKGRGKLTDGDTYIGFWPQEDGTLQGMIVTPTSAKDKGGWAAFTLQTVTLGAYHYMNVRETFADGKPATGPMADNTIPVLYRLTGDGTLVLYLIDEAAAKRAIKAGELIGTVGEGEFGDVTVTAAPGDLDTLMASPKGRALFVKPLVLLKRVN